MPRSLSTKLRTKLHTKAVRLGDNFRVEDLKASFDSPGRHGGAAGTVGRGSKHSRGGDAKCGRRENLRQAVQGMVDAEVTEETPGG